MINNFKKPGEQKIQLTMKLKFMSSADSKEKLTMHTKSDRTDNMIGKGKDKIIEKLLHLFLRRYHTGLEQSVKVAIFCLIISMVCIKSVVT